tara:strand:+ start:1102 stop:1701 length:600 start_codon:yes stop_codon:yes gene_type:complete
MYRGPRKSYCNCNCDLCYALWHDSRYDNHTIHECESYHKNFILDEENAPIPIEDIPDDVIERVNESSIYGIDKYDIISEERISQYRKAEIDSSITRKIVHTIIVSPAIAICVGIGVNILTSPFGMCVMGGAASTMAIRSIKKTYEHFNPNWIKKNEEDMYLFINIVNSWVNNRDILELQKKKSSRKFRKTAALLRKMVY